MPPDRAVSDDSTGGTGLIELGHVNLFTSETGFGVLAH